MKIAIVTPGRSHLLDCAKEFVKRGHQVRFYTMVHPARCMKFGLDKNNVESFFLLCAPLMFLFRKIRFPGDFNRRLYYWVCRIVDGLAAMRLKDCDVIISISGCSIHAVKKAKKKYGAKILIDRGARHILSQKKILAKMPNAEQVYEPDIKIELQQYQLADHIIVPSQHVKESFLDYGFDEDIIFSDPYGVDLTMFRPQVDIDKKYDVIFVGNWTLQKGVDVLVEACRQRKLTLLHVGAIGDCSQPDEDWFRHVDPVNQYELTKYYNQARILALPSRQDGFGLVLFQAMACGLPLAYSHTTGGPDLRNIIHQKDFLVESSALSPEDLGEALVKAIAKSHEVPLGESYLTEDDINEITWDAYGRRYDQFLTNCINA